MSCHIQNVFCFTEFLSYSVCVPSFDSINSSSLSFLHTELQFIFKDLKCVREYPLRNQTFPTLFFAIIIILRRCSVSVWKNDAHTQKVKTLKDCYNTLQPVDRAFSFSHNLI